MQYSFLDSVAIAKSMEIDESAFSDFMEEEETAVSAEDGEYKYIRSLIYPAKLEF